LRDQRSPTNRPRRGEKGERYIGGGRRNQQLLAPRGTLSKPKKVVSSAYYNVILSRGEGGPITGLLGKCDEEERACCRILLLSPRKGGRGERRRSFTNTQYSREKKERGLRTGDRISFFLNQPSEEGKSSNISSPRKSLNYFIPEGEGGGGEPASNTILRRKSWGGVAGEFSYPL